MSASNITPVTILTGFLGSGKTTLLNELLQSPQLQDTAVLINEYGDVAIDHLLVRTASDNISVLANGCVCCSVAGDMVRALRDLYFKRANGEVPAFSRVIIETTGLADPAPIMHTLLEMPLVAARYVLSGIITTIDSTHGLAQLATHPESAKQAAVADRLVLTKTDLANLASAESVTQLRTQLHGLNPGATIIEAAHGRTDVGKLFDTGLYRAYEKTLDVQQWLRAEAYRPVAQFKHYSRSVDPSRHDERIAAFSVTIELPVMWDSLIDVLEMLQSMRGDQLLRIKGIVNVTGEALPRAIHAVQHTIYPFITLASWPSDERTTKLVFIVRDLDPVFIEQTLKTMIQQGVSAKNASKPLPALAI